ncbi:MAG: ATP synthase F1 subunit gamma [Desulfobulbaceae bacterium]|nr:ATP synthase F1 subunit gamma [Desulfobulbaceae bacterium]
MASLKDVKSKIGGVKKTAQITSAMNMVAASKLRGAQSKMEKFRPYAAKFNQAMGNLSSGMDSAQFPLMAVRPVQNIELVIVTSDRGLCGSFNANVISSAEKLIKRYTAEGKKVSLVCVGKKAIGKMKKTGLVRKQYADLMGSFQMFNARAIAQDVAENFLMGNTDQVQLVYAEFKSVAVQRPTTVALLPIQPAASDAEVAATSTGDYLYEPSPDQIMEVLQPLYLNVMVYSSMLEVAAGENAARMSSMDNATKACKDIIHSLTLVYNKARQSSITAELMDIVGGAEALKG